MKLTLEGKVEDGYKRHFVIGAALDCLLTSPERWNDDFVVVDIMAPSGLLGKFVDALPIGLTPTSAPEEYQTAYEASGYKKGIEWAINYFWNNSEAVRYYNLKSADWGDAQVLTTDMKRQVDKALELLQANPFTYKYFYPTNNLEINHQIPIYFTYMGIECKALLDGVIIDNNKRTIQPFDLKSTSKSVYEFTNSFLTYGYYRQCAFYEQALLSKDSPYRNLLDSGYKLLDYQFVVTETNIYSSRAAVIFETRKEDRQCGLEGCRVNGSMYPGINSLIEDYLWHKEQNLWDLPRYLYRSQGIIHLNINYE